MWDIEKRLDRPLVRVPLILLLGAFALFYLRFGLQALAHFLPQGALSLVGAIALGWGALRISRREPASVIVLSGTVPVLLLHAVMTFQDAGELPFLIGSAPVPVLAGALWLASRER